MMSDKDYSTPSPAIGTLHGREINEEPSLRLDDLPLIFVLPTHLSIDELEGIETVLNRSQATITYDIAEASIILGAVNTFRRAKFELNTRNVVAEVFELETDDVSIPAADEHEPVLGKRKRVDELPSERNGVSDLLSTVAHARDRVLIVRLDWLHDSMHQHRALSLEGYIVCTAKIIKPNSEPGKLSASMPVAKMSRQVVMVPSSQVASDAIDKHQGRKFTNQRKLQHPPVRPLLTRESTAEHDRGLQIELPPTPAWVREGKVYACERVTLPDSPNGGFLDLLEKIRLSRVLIDDQIGVRAYSTSIASLAAYPYKLSAPQEIHRLPGCDQKVETLFREYQSTGTLSASKAIDEDSALRVIRDFYNIWGVGAKTARDWYYERGWREHDDIIQYGWNDLSRVQQIGLKFFDEFELKIPRAEVEAIALIVDEHAKALTDARMTCTIVGGYRRGKSDSGDVDIILSHPEESTTHYLIHDLVGALDDSGWVTHTLTLSEANSQREQQTLGLRVDSSKGGFDTLDKALLVWQDPNWPDQERARRADPHAKNPNVHRRVDIIVSPWRTIGCAIAGWSSGTTFQRDLRRFAKHKHGWKFDSSGVRDRKTGRWIDLERWTDPKTRAETPLEAEKRVFEGLGLEYRAPKERCTR